MEDVLLGEKSKVQHSLVKQRSVAEITNGEAASGDPTATGRPGEILIELTARENQVDALELAVERRAIREIFGGFNRLGVAVATGHACIYTIAVCEGRYFAAVWLRWKPYIVHRRDRGNGRERIYAPAESLMHALASVMLENLTDTPDGRRYWEALLESTFPLRDYYSFSCFGGGDDQD